MHGIRTAGRPALGIAIGIGLVLLNSCGGHPVLDLAAVYRDGSGRIMVELGQCGKKVDARGPTLTVTPDEGDTTYWGTGRDPGRPGPFLLFAPPGAWAVKGKPGGPRALEPRHGYNLHFTVLEDGHRVRYTSSSDFRREDIDSLRPGQLWANGEAMSRERFRAHVTSEC
ncbi:hypothetical protein ACE1OC_12460 [Streptomyces sp. DSM 116496]|uniref:hypothetical protein n=1 Tax=Streptomyces stoeckheimensis TaxID=3344656 RepID=UPI0038B24346